MVIFHSYVSLPEGNDKGRNLGDVLARRLRLVQEEKATAPVPIPKAPKGEENTGKPESY